jgi:hypothetical protein
MSHRVERMIGKFVCMKESLTVTHQCLYEVRVRRKAIHPPPPSKFPEWLQYTVAISNPLVTQEYEQEGGKRNSQDQDEREQEVNNNAATSIVGAIAATACPMVV